MSGCRFWVPFRNHYAEASTLNVLHLLIELGVHKMSEGYL